ncbi:MAG: hypothetical protein RMJ15_06835 [Nitrososphaerota archaeon]|nr:hypothetical protein [Candidatus Bathyarchaeota archaeon]MDW8023433.1 hypothetical protein [Nitrososphaerota archaeon]MDW8194564.1 hypothetical protein [Nitrososphaerota archaeon]
MIEEKSLKLEGEELAKIAVDSGMGAKQLRTIRKLVKTRPLAYVEAFVQMQIGRGVSGRAGFIKVLELIRKYEDGKVFLEKVLTYAVMLYDYYEKEPTRRLESIGEPIVKRIVEGHGFVFNKATMRLQGRILEINVKVDRFHGNPKALAMEIEKALRGKEEFSNLNMKVWIESQ